MADFYSRLVYRFHSGLELEHAHIYDCCVMCELRVEFMRHRTMRLAREVRYKVDGVPGLRIRRANTNDSWRWTPISPSPVAKRTRSSIKE